MHNRPSWLAWLLAGLALAALARTAFTVDETQMVVVTQFGRPLRTVKTAGLHVKAPWQTALRFDRRLRTFSPRAAELLTRDKKNLLVNTYVAWRIRDPQQFLQTVIDRAGAETRLRDLVTSELSIALGQLDLSDLLAVDAKDIQLEPMMARVTEGCRQAADAGSYGLEIVDVRMRRLNFPEQNKAAVFQRMRAERERIARQYRAEGTEQATRIRADADRQKTELLANAYEEAEKIRGAGDQQSMQIYGSAYNQDARFYRLSRTLEAYRKFLTKQTTVVLSSDSELLRLLTQGQEAGR